MNSASEHRFLKISITDHRDTPQSTPSQARSESPLTLQTPATQPAADSRKQSQEQQERDEKTKRHRTISNYRLFPDAAQCFEVFLGLAASQLRRHYRTACCSLKALCRARPESHCCQSSSSFSKEMDVRQQHSLVHFAVVLCQLAHRYPLEPGHKWVRVPAVDNYTQEERNRELGESGH